MLVIGTGETRVGDSIPLATRNGWSIPNETRMERISISLKAGEQFWRDEHPDARLRSSTATYNCYGMVFASRRTWVDVEYIGKILKYDSYKRIDETEIELGDIVVYRDEERDEITHVGIIADKMLIYKEGKWDLWIMSKWGEAGEYIHRIDDVPDTYGNLYEFWSERRQVS